MGDAHNRTRYLAGCRCDTCKLAQSTYRKQLNQRKNAEKIGAAPSPVKVQVPASDAPAIAADGSVLAAVNLELEQLTSAETRPGLAETARALARLLDTPVAMAQHPSAAGKLVEILEVLGKTGRQRKSKLAAVIEMTQGA